MEKKTMDKKELAKTLFYIKTTHQYPSGFDKELAKELEEKGVVYHAAAFRCRDINSKIENNTYEEVDTLMVDEKKLESIYGVVIERDYDAFSNR